MINEEEKQFLKTLSRGRRVFERTVERMDPSVSVIPGESAVQLEVVVNNEVERELLRNYHEFGSFINFVSVIVWGSKL